MFETSGATAVSSNETREKRYRSGQKQRGKCCTQAEMAAVVSIPNAQGRLTHHSPAGGVSYTEGVSVAEATTPKSRQRQRSVFLSPMFALAVGIILSTNYNVTAVVAQCLFVAGVWCWGWGPWVGVRRRMSSMFFFR